MGAVDQGRSGGNAGRQDRRALKVSGQRRVIGMLDVESYDELDQILMSGLPMADYLEFEKILPVREYAAFAEDIRNHWSATAS